VGSQFYALNCTEFDAKERKRKKLLNVIFRFNRLILLILHPTGYQFPKKKFRAGDSNGTARIRYGFGPWFSLLIMSKAQMGLIACKLSGGDGVTKVCWTLVMEEQWLLVVSG
jgi:hypothetical protein